MPSAEIAMVTLTAASTGMSIIQAKAQDDAQQAALAMQRAAMEDEDNMRAIQAMQLEAERLEQLDETRNLQIAALAAKGRTVDGTGGPKAIKQRTLGQADRDIKNIRLNRQFQRRRFQLGQADIAAQSSASRTNRNLQIGSALISGTRSLMSS